MDKIKLQDIFDFFDQSVCPPSEENPGCREFTAINLHGTEIALKIGGHFYYKWTVGKEDFERIKKECEETIGEKLPFDPPNRRFSFSSGENNFELEELPDEQIVPSDENPEFDDIREIVETLK